MGEDLSTGAKIGIILIILCSLIAIVFSLLTMMKNITNSGSAQLQNSLDQMLIAKFDDYNQTTVTGNQVTASIKVFEGADVAIVIRPHNATLAKAGNLQALGGYNYGAVLCGYNGGTSAAAAADAGEGGGAGEGEGAAAAKEPGVDLKGYGKVLLSKTPIDLEGTDTCPLYDSKSDLTKGLFLHKSGTYYVGELYIAPDNILVSTNPNSRPINASGRPTYVRSNAKYRAMLIKDASDAIIGVCFDELVMS